MVDWSWWWLTLANTVDYGQKMAQKGVNNSGSGYNQPHKPLLDVLSHIHTYIHTHINHKKNHIISLVGSRRPSRRLHSHSFKALEIFREARFATYWPALLALAAMARYEPLWGQRWRHQEMVAMVNPSPWKRTPPPGPTSRWRTPERILVTPRFVCFEATGWSHSTLCTAGDHGRPSTVRAQPMVTIIIYH